MKYFYSSIFISIIGIVLSYVLGGLQAIYICTLLAILEVSLSFDNAVVNAKVLDKMDEIWQKRFIVFGIPVAVFGMRFVFPILIVAIATGLGVVETFNLALYEPHKYQLALEAKKELIYAFGGLFLLMVFLDFFLEKKDVFWLKALEKNFLAKTLSKWRFSALFIALLISAVLFYLSKDTSILIASISAIILHFAISSLDSFFSDGAVKNGFMGFLYLEVLDASFSFDGVIGAFALSSNIFIIMIGLGIGAFFVRSLTLYLVHKKTLTKFIYLDHGAHWAILMLALIMLAELFVHISEILTGTIGVAFILVSLLSSIFYNKKTKNGK